MDESFQRLYEKYHQDIFQFLYYLVKDREQAEDLVHEVYIKVLKSYSSFEGRSSEKTWLFSIARHVAIDFFRKQKTLRQRIMEKFDLDQAQIADREPLPEEIALQREEIQMLYKAMNDCNVNQRTVLILRFIKELSVAETAEVLGWTESKVKTTQHRALKVLKNYIDKAMKEQGVTKDQGAMTEQEVVSSEKLSVER
ncbi:MAG: RNA polymerase sigma factor SigX [Bacillaceae bacterium]|jgi:RNA polymerase sigma-70 factor, ECF subfamily|uniref:RNA polymerase sigma factor SigX n=2 Tax=Aeribacillus TaxID=1055323 RepID=A0A164B3Y1_9BACI|nr:MULTISPECIES: RNA polymerase sigma factor SigX [Aeribacillus]REJ17518.1 MAG: RNA polymerase sigma factor SigX [Bacillaceae bacterium]KZM56923.1 RNA polymerase sigma factor SigX [Aeribacillus pallidus]KZN95888.1 RNA polymerase sigma factor SigX [Aeribacillus pallidus]MED0649544.1 RNA polymerase sigma factor SigX [Aeribacillus composti]MED0715899.1 RNA polymerase sigma factor SigX [Aeribacillus composti]